MKELTIIIIDSAKCGPQMRTKCYLNGGQVSVMIQHYNESLLFLINGIIEDRKGDASFCFNGAVSWEKHSTHCFVKILSRIIWKN